MVIIQQVISGLIIAFILLIITALFLFFSLNIRMRKDHKEKISMRVFLSSLISKYITDKIELSVFELEETSGFENNLNNHQFDHNEANLYEKFHKRSITTIESINTETIRKHNILTRRSRNYGADEKYSIRTWYGISYLRLSEDKYQYLTLKIRDENIDFTFRKDDLLKIIHESITTDAIEKYTRRDSLDIYLVKSKENFKWYIIRLGVHLEDPIEVVNDSLS